MTSHVQLYNALKAAIRRDEMAEAIVLAKRLYAALKESMMSYGWQKLPLTSCRELDTVLLALDKYFTGDRQDFP